MSRIRVLALLTCSLALAACSDDSADKAGDDTSQPATTSISLLSPLDGATTGADVTLSYEVSGLTLDGDAIGTENVEGHGHVHIYVDGTYLDVTGETSYALTGLADGTHSLEVRLAENDHTEIAGATASVEITVATEVAGDPLLAITSPAFGDDFDTSSFQLGLVVQNFTLSDAIGGANVAGEGHYHITVDGAYYDYNNSLDGAWVTRLTPGEHEIMVELVNNDHSPLSPSVMDTTQVVVNPGARYVQIDSPLYGLSLNTSSYEVGVSVNNFTLDPDAIGGTSVEGTGHYHLYVDGVYEVASGDSSAWLYQQGTGEHVIMAVLADNDHTELDTVDYVRISSPEDRPSIALTSPPVGEALPSSFAVAFNTENFTLSEDVGGTTVEGEGHVHVLIDGTYWTLGSSSPITVEGVSSGEHELSVMLVNNDHSELDPFVIDAQPITVR